MFLEMLTPDKLLFEGDIFLVRVPGTKGSFEVLNNHTPIISTLDEGNVKIITDQGKEEFFDIKKGFIEVKDNKIKLLVTL